MSRVPRARARKRHQVFPGLTLIAIGPKRNLPEVARWFQSCTSDGNDHITPSDVVVLFESMGHIPVCYLLRNLLEQLYDQHLAGERLMDVRGNEITSQQFRVIVSAGRRHLSEFRERYKRTEITRVSNLIVKPLLIQHHARLADAKGKWMSGEIDKRQLKHIQLTSSNDFDKYYTEVKNRAKRLFESLGPNETLTTRKVARNDAEYEAAHAFM